MKTVVIVLTLLAVALGAGGGFVTGFTMTLIDRVRTDLQVGCAVMQTAESAGFITREQRSKLIDKVVPPIPKDVELPAGTDWKKAFVQGWWDAIREDLKSGCRGVGGPAAEGNA
jgi:hypothetical protein